MATDRGGIGRSARRLGLTAAAMFALGFAVVPLYGLICEAAGIGKVAATVPPAEGRTVTVKFDATVQRDLPWRIEPVERAVRVRVGETREVRYKVRNLTSRKIVGQAVPSVVPWQATPHFSKVECFCFQNQTLSGGEEKELPLRFFVSAELPEGTDSLTVSYTFVPVDSRDAI